MFRSGGSGAAAKKKRSETRTKNPPRSLAQFGLMDVGGEEDDDGGGGGRDNDDEDLEAELNAIIMSCEDGGHPATLNPGPSGTKARPSSKDRTTAPGVKADKLIDLESMVAACMKDDEDHAEDDDEDGLDEDDPELLGELADLQEPGSEDGLVGKRRASDLGAQNDQGCDDAGEGCAGESLLNLINSRISLYEAASERMRTEGESAKARRYARALGTLKEQRSRVRSGKALDPADIPPAVSLPSPLQEPPQPLLTLPEPLQLRFAQPGPSRPAQPNTDQPEKPAQPRPPQHPEPPNRGQQQQIVDDLMRQRERYKAIALASKVDGDIDSARWGLKGVKACDALIARAKAGELVDLAELPEERPSAKATDGLCQQAAADVAPKVQISRAFSRDDPIQLPENPEDVPPASPAVFGAPLQPPGTIKEALVQRLEKYRADEAKAKEEANASRARRIGRICKQYEEALKLHNAGRPVPVEELPTPPGFAPIPVPGALNTSTSSMSLKPLAPSGPPSTSNSPKPSPPAQSKSPRQDRSGKEVQQPSLVQGSNTSPQPQPAMTVTQRQIAFLEKRQAMFKAAALEAKKANNIEQAKDYLRQAKGFDKLIEAAKCGLPVDITSLPVPPQSVKKVEMGFEIVSKEDCSQSAAVQELGKTGRHEMYAKLEQDLIKQVKTCDANIKHFKGTGDVASMNRFHQMAEHTKKDLDALRFAFRRGDAVPKFHYEVRSFSRVVCNTDLSDHELEFSVERGVNLSVSPSSSPKQLDTYCRIEFPYPKEAPFKDKTAWVRGTSNPEYNHKVIVAMNLKDKGCQRIFKRQAAKVEVWSKVGFLRSDALLGTATVKLLPLETVCTLHDTFPLMEGRKAVGGKVEVKLRLRNAVASNQVERVEEKWLVVTFV